MPRTRFDQHQVDRLAPSVVGELRDAELRGFDVRAFPSGRKRYFVQFQHEGRRTWHVLGDACNMSLGSAPGLAGGRL